MSQTAIWSGYTFNVHPANASFYDVAGIYIFTGINQHNVWVPFYIGQATSLANRLAGHEKWSPATKLGATHIHAMAVSKQADRNFIEETLIKRCQPQLNSQLK